MKKVFILTITASAILSGCASNSQSVMTNEQFDALASGKSDTVVVNNRQSHGLIGDLIHNVLPHPNN